MLITPGHEAGRVHSSKDGPDAAEPQSRVESVPLRGSSTTEGRCLSGDTLSTRFTTCEVCGCKCVHVGASVCICFCKHGKMRGSCPQWPCRLFSLHGAVCTWCPFKSNASYSTSLSKFPAGCLSPLLCSLINLFFVRCLSCVATNPSGFELASECTTGMNRHDLVLHWTAVTVCVCVCVR